MRYKVGDVVLVKMKVMYIINDSPMLAAVDEKNKDHSIYVTDDNIIALVSRKPKKDKPIIRAEGYFVDHPEEANGAFQPAKWSKLDMGEPFYPDLLAQGWQFDSFPNNYRDVKLLLKDGSQITGWFTGNEWWRFGDSSCNRIGITAHVAAWKELDK